MFIAHELKLDGYNCQYGSGSPQFNGKRKFTLRQQKAKISLLEVRKLQLKKDQRQLSSTTGKRLLTRSEGAGIETALRFYPRLATGRWYKKVLRMEQYQYSFLSQEWLRVSRKGFVNSNETGYYRSVADSIIAAGNANEKQTNRFCQSKKQSQKKGGMQQRIPRKGGNVEVFPRYLCTSNSSGSRNE